MPAFRAVFRKYDRLNESVEENVRAMRVVKGFAREQYEKEKFAAASHDIAKDFTFAERVVALNGPLMQFCVYFNMVFVLFIGSNLIITGGGTTIDVGQLSAMLTYGMQILMSLMMISMIYVMLTMSYESFLRICEVLEEEPAFAAPSSPATDVKDGSIDFENVSFKYSAQAKKFALQGINLHIASGMTVGILGGTGSSKSTLVQLIPRLYDATEGSVKVGGVDVRDARLDEDGLEGRLGGRMVREHEARRLPRPAGLHVAVSTLELEECVAGQRRRARAEGHAPPGRASSTTRGRTARNFAYTSASTRGAARSACRPGRRRPSIRAGSSSAWRRT